MSKYIISNSKSFLSSIQHNTTKYKVSCNFELPLFHGIAYHKLSIDNINYYNDDKGGCVIVGTPIAPNISEKNLSKYLYATFTPDSISKFKKQILGMWSAVVWHHDAFYIFNDYYGLYDVCYYQDNDTFVISTLLSDLLIGRKNLQIEEYPFIMEMFQLGAFPGMSPFKDCYKLKSNEFIEYSISSFLVKEIPNKELLIDTPYISQDSTIRNIVSNLGLICKRISNVYAPIYVNMTGGLDSRLMFGAFLSSDIDFSCIHGVATNTTLGDKVIVEQICSRYNKELIIQDWNSTSDFSFIEQDKLFEKVGFYNYLYGGNPHRYEILEEAARNFQFSQSGYFCEALRLREWVENKGDYFSIQDFVDNYYINSALKESYTHFDHYRSFLIDNFCSLLNTIGFTGSYDKIPVDLFERFRWIMARYCDSRSVFQQNLNAFSFPIMSLPAIHESILSLPADVIRGGQFQMKLVYALFPDLLDNFDLFSHRRAYYVKNFKKHRKFDFKNLGDIFLGAFSFAKPFILKTYKNYKYSASDHANLVYTQINSIGVHVPDYLNIQKGNLDLSRLRSFFIGVRYLNNIEGL